MWRASEWKIELSYYYPISCPHSCIIKYAYTHVHVYYIVHRLGTTALQLVVTPYSFHYLLCIRHPWKKLHARALNSVNEVIYFPRSSTEEDTLIARIVILLQTSPRQDPRTAVWRFKTMYNKKSIFLLLLFFFSFFSFFFTIIFIPIYYYFLVLVVVVLVVVVLVSDVCYYFRFLFSFFFSLFYYVSVFCFCFILPFSARAR